jgi:hypothetical protein
MSSSEGEEETKSKKIFSGEIPEEYDIWQKDIARWCRKRHGAALGDMYWENVLPILDTTYPNAMTLVEFNVYAKLVHKSINARDFRRATFLWTHAEFWTRAWHVEIRQEEYDRIYDYVESRTKGDAAIEVESLGRTKACEMKTHLQKHFGGSGSDVRSRESIYEDGMPESAGKAVFYSGVNMEKKLRQMANERNNLTSMCPEANRDTYEFAKETTLVKIVLKHLRGTEFHETAKKLLSEIKVLKQARALIPVYDSTGHLELPDTTANTTLSADWDFRNYATDWLPSWADLRSALVSDWKEASFQGGAKGKKESVQIPTMMNPGFGQLNADTLVPKCYGCGMPGHRIGASECTAEKNVIHSSAPEHVKRNQKKRKQAYNGGGQSNANGNKFQGGKQKQYCNYFAKNGTCRFGSNCKFSHDKKPQNDQGGQGGAKRFKKGEQAKFVALAVKAFENKIKSAKQKQKKKNRKKKEEKEDSGSEDEAWLASLCFIQTIPRLSSTPAMVELSTLATSSLLDMTDVGMDTCSGRSISTRKSDFLWIDETTTAKRSVKVRGPSVGTPKCGGTGPLAYRVNVNGKRMMIVDPDGVFADVRNTINPEFRILSTQRMRRLGIETTGGVYEEEGKAICARTNVGIPLPTKDNILVMSTPEKVSGLLPDSPDLRMIVDEIRTGKRSPIVDLDDLWDTGEHDVNKFTGLKLLTTLLLATTIVCAFSTSTMIMNEGRISVAERSRLWCRRLGYCDTNVFTNMRKLPEYGNFPNVKAMNEDNKVATQAKFKRKPYPRNDPSITMQSPPWWRTFCDGYGGQGSLGGDSYEGAVGGYLFVCPSTGSEDLRLYASHEQFPIALHQFLVRVEAEHWKVRVMFVDTHSVNLSAEAQEVAALFKMIIQPASAGTPQEMSFVESRVRLLKRHSTAQLLGAPHLPKDSWALSDKYAIYCRQFMPQATREFHCSYFLRTGRVVDWDIVFVKTFGAPVDFSPLDGPVHKRAAITEEGYFVGMQWPAALVRRKSDMKVLSVSTKKLKVYESAYIVELDKHVEASAIEDEFKHQVVDNLVDVLEESSSSSSSGFASTMADRELPPATKNMVQSITSHREHLFDLPGSRVDAIPRTKLDDAAIFGASVQGEEGLYVSECGQSTIEKVHQQIEQLKDATASTVESPSVRNQILTKLSQASDLLLGPAVQKGSLKIGKKTGRSGIDKSNILSHHVLRNEPSSLVGESSSTSNEGTVSSVANSKTSGHNKKGAKKKIKKGDMISCDSAIFDGDVPGSYSDDHPERSFGIVLAVSKTGLVQVRWKEGNEIMPVKAKDCKLEIEKVTSTSIIIFLIEGNQVAFQNKDNDDWPKDFFKLLVKADWRKWVEAVKHELEGWNDNNAVTVVDFNDVPLSARIVPLGELYSIKRDGRYKYRQYLLGNLLREGVDFKETFSTTVSSSGICVFYSLSTTCQKEVWGWDAVCGYLQAKEQHDLYAFFPSHQQYSSMTYEELAMFRTELLKLVATEGEAGLKRLSSMHKRETRKNPRQVLRLNSAIYGAPSAGHEFEMLIQSVHIKACGLTQTQPEPSMYVKIHVDENDNVTGYLLVMAFVDDVRFFGTDPEVQQYMMDVKSKIKVTFDKPPVAEFVSIETHSDFKYNTTELKMPKYWDKASIVFASYFEKGMKARKTPLSVIDEKVLMTKASEQEIAEAKHLPYAELTGVISYPAANCKFEMRYVVSLLGRHRAGWSLAHFGILLKAFEYGCATKQMGLMYSANLDPHGNNVLWASADSAHSVPRSQGCRIVLMNGAAVSFRSKKHTITAASTCQDEIIEMYEASTDILGLRNLMSELGMYQQNPTLLDQDNKSAIQIANNRGSLGPTSRAIDLKTLSVRNRIEDHQIQTVYCPTPKIIADMGTKALPEEPFCQHRDTMNGYGLVKAAYPDVLLPPYVLSMSLEDIVLMIKSIPTVSIEDMD